MATKVSLEDVDTGGGLDAVSSNPFTRAGALEILRADITGAPLTDAQKIAWDLNGDGIVNIKDGRLALQYSEGSATPSAEILRQYAGGPSAWAPREPEPPPPPPPPPPPAPEYTINWDLGGNNFIDQSRLADTTAEQPNTTTQTVQAATQNAAQTIDDSVVDSNGRPINEEVTTTAPIGQTVTSNQAQPSNVSLVSANDDYNSLLQKATNLGIDLSSIPKNPSRGGYQFYQTNALANAINQSISSGATEYKPAVSLYDVNAIVKSLPTKEIGAEEARQLGIPAGQQVANGRGVTTIPGAMVSVMPDGSYIRATGDGRAGSFQNYEVVNSDGTKSKVFERDQTVTPDVFNYGQQEVGLKDIAQAAINVAGFIPGMQPIVGLYNAYNAFDRGDVLGGLAGLAGVGGFTDVASGIRLANAIKNQDVAGALAALGSSKLTSEIANTKIGDFKLGDIAKTASIAANLSSPNPNYAQALADAGMLAKSPEAVMAAKGLSLFQAIESGNPAAIIGAVAGVGRTINKTIPNAIPVSEPTVSSVSTIGASENNDQLGTPSQDSQTISAAQDTLAGGAATDTLGADQNTINQILGTEPNIPANGTQVAAAATGTVTDVTAPFKKPSEMTADELRAANEYLENSFKGLPEDQRNAALEAAAEKVGWDFDDLLNFNDEYDFKVTKSGNADETAAAETGTGSNAQLIGTVAVDAQGNPLPNDSSISSKYATLIGAGTGVEPDLPSNTFSTSVLSGAPKEETTFIYPELADTTTAKTDTATTRATATTENNPATTLAPELTNTPESAAQTEAARETAKTTETKQADTQQENQQKQFDQLVDDRIVNQGQSVIDATKTVLTAMGLTPDEVKLTSLETVLDPLAARKAVTQQETVGTTQPSGGQQATVTGGETTGGAAATLGGETAGAQTVTAGGGTTTGETNKTTDTTSGGKTTTTTGGATTGGGATAGGGATVGGGATTADLTGGTVGGNAATTTGGTAATTPTGGATAGGTTEMPNAQVSVATNTGTTGTAATSGTTAGLSRSDLDAAVSAGTAGLAKKEDIDAAIAGIRFPAGLSKEDVRQVVSDSLAANPGLTADQVNNIVRGAISSIPEGMKPEDVRSIVNQSITSGTANLASKSDVNAAVAAGTAGLASKADIDAAIAGIQFPAGLSASDVNGIVSKAFADNPGITADQVQRIVGNAVSNIPPGLSSEDVTKIVNASVSSGTANLASKSDVNAAVTAGTAGLARKEDVDAAIAGIKFPPGLSEGDVSGIVNKAFADNPGITSDQVNKIVKDAVAGIPAGLSTGDVKGIVDQSVANGVANLATKGDVTSAVTAGTAGLATQQGLTEAEGRFNSRVDDLLSQGKTLQQATEQAIAEVGAGVSDIKKAQEDAKAAQDAINAANAANRSISGGQLAIAAAPAVAAESEKKSTVSPLSIAGGAAAFSGPLAEFFKMVQSGSYTNPQPQQQAPRGALAQQQQPEAPAPKTTTAADFYNYGQSDNDIDEVLGLNPQQTYKSGGLATVLMAGGGTTRYGKYAGGGLNVVPHSGKMRIDFRQGDAVTGAGDGQSDDIPAMLADGEFVIPADVVAALGNGSTKAGSDALYDMMHSIRAHTRKAHPKSLPPPAKSPLDYIKKKRK